MHQPITDTVEYFRATTDVNALWERHGRDIDAVKGSPEYDAIVERMRSGGMNVTDVKVRRIEYRYVGDPAERFIETVEFVVE